MSFQTIPADLMDHTPNRVSCYRRLAVRDYDTTKLSRHTLRPRATKCEHCQALLWLEERVSGSTLGRPRFGRCCNHGKILLDPIKGTPGPLADLFLKVANGSAAFLQIIRKYNTGFCMTSLGVKIDQGVTYAAGT